MNIICNQSLKAFNSFGFAVQAEHFVSIDTDDELIDALRIANDNDWPVFLLGGGSNLVLTQDIKGLVIHQTNTTTHYDKQSDGSTLVTVDAGKPWHELVLETLDNGLTGLENLSLIPGNTGAAPVQNIGAYGVELADRMHSVRCYHRPSQQWLTLLPDDCVFGYRDSVFKREPNQYVITQVVFQLRSDTPPVLSYKALARAMNVISDRNPKVASSNTNPIGTGPGEPVAQAKLISDTVIRIRQSKLPDPKQLGNAGSFFKNPVISKDHAEALKVSHPDIVSYPLGDGQLKLAAGWLIDELGFRGIEADGVGVHTEQALVLVNRGDGDGQALMALARAIIDRVDKEFGVKLEIEPIVV